MKNANTRNFIVWGIVIALLLAMIAASNTTLEGPAKDELTYSELQKRVQAGDVKSALIDVEGGVITGTLNNDEKYRTNIGPINLDADALFDGTNIPYEFEERTNPSVLGSLLVGILPILLIAGLFLLFFKNMQGGGRGGAMNFGKSKAKLLTENNQRKTFDDVAGVEAAKEDLKEVVEFLQDPTRFTRLGARIPTGALLVGPPGTGKTLLARAVAGEAGVPFYTISGSDFVEMFVGVGASRVREMFAEARKQAPCIIFIDEIDAVGRHRGVGTSGGHEEREQTLNQLLVEMDGFEGDEGIIIIAATNRPDVLDKALLRPGRFDRQIEVPYPDIQGREKILEVHMKGKPIAADVEIK